MIKAEETFGGTWPFKPNFCSTSGFQQHFLDEGPADGEVILCLHGEPTWGYLYRNLIPPLAKDYRVIVPDHMGFGKSETPQDRTYTLKTHVENLTSLIDYLDLSNVTFVGQDWGGPIAGAYTVRHPHRVKRLVLMNTLLGYAGLRPPEGRTPWFDWIAKHEEAGTLEGILGELSSTVLSVMKIVGFEDSSAVTEQWIRAYSEPFPDRESCIGAIQFPLDVHYQRIVPYVVEGLKNGDLNALRKKPAMLAYGLSDHAIEPQYAISDFKSLFPKSRVTELPGVGHYCQEDAPEVLVRLIQDFMRTTP